MSVITETEMDLQGQSSPEFDTNAVPFACPVCRTPLIMAQLADITCEQCKTSYTLRNGQPDFRLDVDRASETALVLDQTEQWQNRIKMKLRQNPWFYRFLVYTIGPVLLLGPTSQQFVDSLGANARVLSIGAGVLRLRGNITHLDYEPYPHLEVVGDAQCLPFLDNTFDGVVCETLLEHVLEPEQVIAEMHRVLKPGGTCYVMMPFMFGFHAAPSDFQRFTHKGLLHRMRAFDTVRLKVVSGPASALTCVLVEWLAIFFSFGSQRLYQMLSLAFLLLLSPLKLLDFVMSYHPEAMRIASIFLYIGRKPSLSP